MKNPKIEIYKDTAGKWRWRARAKNGKVVADSAEGYSRQCDCLRAIDVLDDILGMDKREIKEKE